MCVCVCVYAAVSECVNASAAVVSEGTKKREKKKTKDKLKKEKNWTVLLIVSRFVPLFRMGSFVCFFFGFLFLAFLDRNEWDERTVGRKSKKKQIRPFLLFFDFSHLICFARVFFFAR